MKKTFVIFASLFSFLLSFAPGVQALVLPQMTVEEMVLKADAIVSGRSERFHMHPDSEGNVIYAFVNFKVKEYLKNDLGKEEIIIAQVAQEKGFDGKFTAGPVALRIDEEVILFLTEEDNQGFRHILGLSQGKYSVVQDRRGEKRLIQEMQGVRLFNRETGKISDGKTVQVKMTYDEFKFLVYRIVSRIRARKEKFAITSSNNFF